MSNGIFKFVQINMKQLLYDVKLTINHLAFIDCPGAPTVVLLLLNASCYDAHL